MKERLRAFFDGLVNAFLVIMLLINLYNIVERNVFKQDLPQICGYSYAIVVSGSMQPEIYVNDLVYIHKEPSYNIGDVVTYKEAEGDNYITHRIVDKTEEGFITKGDANNTQDKDPVTEDQIVGKIVFKIPAIGAAVSKMKTPVGTLCIVLLALLLLELPYQLKLDSRRRIEKELARRIEETPEDVSPEDLRFNSLTKKQKRKIHEINEGMDKKRAKLDRATKKAVREEEKYRKAAEKAKQRAERDLAKGKQPKVFIPDDPMWDISVEQHMEVDDRMLRQQAKLDKANKHAQREEAKYRKAAEKAKLKAEKAMASGKRPKVFIPEDAMWDISTSEKGDLLSGFAEETTDTYDDGFEDYSDKYAENYYDDYYEEQDYDCGDGYSFEDDGYENYFESTEYIQSASSGAETESDHVFLTTPDGTTIIKSKK